ncbi:3913_t:CDS:2, partial [Dentiscutata heterogama]
MVLTQSKVPRRRVAIVGGGLVGTLAALYFAKRDWNVDLFELRKALSSDPRITGNQDRFSQKSINLALSARGLSALANTGLNLDEIILNFVIPMKGRMIHIDKGELRSQPYGIFGECIYSVGRKALLELLLNTTKKFTNIKIYFQHRMKTCNFDSGSLEFENWAEEVKVQHTADLIIGADGAYSSVRSQLMRVVNMDYHQEYITHAYCELTIPPIIDDKGDSKFAMDPNHLHIWPRHTFMMIALPNLDKSFTCTLFMPNKSFDAIKTENELINFFELYFPDSIPLIGEQRLKEYFSNPRGSLMSIKCKPYHYRNRAIIIGDAAHCMVPFYGQGMNCGFQDVELLDSILERFNVTAYNNDYLDLALEEYTKFRQEDTMAICDLAMYNYVEMRSEVVNPWYLIKRKIEGSLHWLFPTIIIPLYTM